MILAPERRYADSHPCAKATHPEAYGIDCGASRALKGVIASRRLATRERAREQRGAARRSLGQHAVTLPGASAGRYARHVANEEVPMTFKVGDRVVAEAESTERVARSGTVREVLREAPAARYRIDWDDGHSTVYTPAAGALHAARQDAEPTR